MNDEVKTDRSYFIAHRSYFIVPVVLRHRFVNAVSYDGVERIACALQNFFHFAALRLCKAFEHE
jgi:hypothetical protein